MNRLINLLCIVTMIFLFSQQSHANTPYVLYPQNKLVFINATLIDGSGGQSKPNQTVSINDGYFEYVGSPKGITIDKHTPIIDLKGKTIIPGLVGVHNHLHRPGQPYNGEAIARLYLAAGVTTIQTVGAAFPEQEIALAQEIQQRKKPGPEIVASGPYFNGPGSHPHMVQAREPQEIRQVMSHWTNKGVKWFKVYRHIEPDQLRNIITEAHKQGAFVTGHLCSVTFSEAVAMGIDGIQHGLNSASDFRTNKTYGKCNGSREYIDNLVIAGDAVKKLQKTMIDNNVFLTSTLSIFESSISHRSLADSRSISVMSKSMQNRYRQMRERHKGKRDSQREKRLKRIMAFDYQFYSLGGLLGAGVDAGRFLLPGYGDQRNFELLIEAGFTATQAIQVMTLNGARILKRDDIGLVSTGKRADFVILTGDLNKNPDVIKNIEAVFKQGIGYDPRKIEKHLQNKIGR